MTRQEEIESAAKALRAEMEQEPIPASLEPAAIEAMLLARQNTGGTDPSQSMPDFKVGAARQRPRMRRWPIALAACLTLLAGAGVAAATTQGALFGPFNTGFDAPAALPQNSLDGADTQALDEAAKATAATPFATAESYEQVRACLVAYEEVTEDVAASAFVTKGIARAENAAADTVAAGLSADGGLSSAKHAAAVTDTHVRTEGVGEADVVKTDGRHLYILQDDAATIAIVDPGDGRMSAVGAVEAPEEAQASEFYLDDGKLYLLSTVFPEGIEQEDGSYTFPPETTRLDTYDVSDPANPTHLATLTQSGTYRTSRFADGYVYLFSDLWSYDTAKREDPAAYVPSVNGEVLKCGDIYLPPAQLGDHYLVITSISTANPGTTADQKAVLCDGGSVYMSGESIFLYETTGQNWGIMPIARFEDTVGEVDAIAEDVTENDDATEGAAVDSPSNDAGENVNGEEAVDDKPEAEDEVFAEDESLGPETPADDQTPANDDPNQDAKEDEAPVSSESDVTQTCIRKFSFEGGKLEGVAQAKVDGIVDDSFCLDEYDGHLRVVTTIYRGSDESENALYILDDQLKETGRIGNIAPGEQVYSARFLGNTGYFVTFKQVDPLFSVDLSDPANPTILGQLKIPGFSEYLHPYSENLLLGIGMSADDAGATDGVKLSMFDVSDPADVSEVATEVLDEAYYSDIFYDYRAALIDPASNIIGFPVSGSRSEEFCVYGYSDGSFSQQMREDVNGTGWQPARGVRIGNVLYVVKGNAVESYEIGTYNKIDDLLI